MTTTLTIAVTVALALLDLFRTVPVRTRVRSCQRLRLVAPFALALAVVVLGTLLYLELVGLILEISG